MWITNLVIPRTKDLSSKMPYDEIPSIGFFIFFCFHAIFGAPAEIFHLTKMEFMGFIECEGKKGDANYLSSAVSKVLHDRLSRGLLRDAQHNQRPPDLLN